MVLLVLEKRFWHSDFFDDAIGAVDGALTDVSVDKDDPSNDILFVVKVMHLTILVLLTGICYLLVQYEGGRDLDMIVKYIQMLYCMDQYDL